jgi:hypothetical protein
LVSRVTRGSAHTRELNNSIARAIDRQQLAIIVFPPSYQLELPAS